VVRIQFFRTAFEPRSRPASSTISGYDQYGFNTDPLPGAYQYGNPWVCFVSTNAVIQQLRSATTG